MFPTAPNPLRARFQRAADRVIEFATLGEYGMSDAGAEPDLDRFELARALPREPAIVRIGSARPDRVRPATAAARLREQAPPKPRPPSARVAPREQPPAAPRPTSTRVALRAMALASSEAASRPAHARKREGAVSPAPQPCLVADQKRP
jgi:hypothetical protein